ncbi:MAG: S46 family peptidase, partial [Steroidobacteraceae bacterium]
MALRRLSAALFSCAALATLTVLTTLAVLAPRARADEGMWTFQHFPAAAVARKYGVRITPRWLDHVRLSTVRLTGCTASFVSPDGLMLTDHHCVQRCLAAHSTRTLSLVDAGYLAESRSHELRCGAQLADVLVAMQEVTGQVLAATRGLAPRAANERRRQTLTRLEQACETASRSRASTGPTAGPLKCQAVE